MSSENPTVFIIHGSWHTPRHFVPLTKLLQSQGYGVVCPPCPTSNYISPMKITPGSPATQLSHYDDAAALRPFLTQLVYEGKDVLVLPHSYGGQVANELVSAELTVKERAKYGQKGGVVGFLYMAAFPLKTGQSMAAAPYPPSQAPPKWIVTNAETGMCDTVGAGPVMYNDMTKAEQDHWDSLCGSQSPLAGVFPLSRCAVDYTPTSYLFCRQDQAVPLAVQEEMVKRQEEFGAEFRKVYCDAGHSPYLSMPEKVVEEIKASIEWSKSRTASAGQ